MPAKVKKVKWMFCATCLPLHHAHLSQIFLSFTPVSPLLDSFIFYPSSALTSSPQSYPQCLTEPEENDAYSGEAAGARDISGDGGDRPWLASKPTSGPDDADWGSVVRQATGWNRGNYWERGGLWTASKEYGRISRNNSNTTFSKDFTSVQDTSILSLLNIVWRLFSKRRKNWRLQ